jgi:hypothetical protein
MSLVSTSIVEPAKEFSRAVGMSIVRRGGLAPSLHDPSLPAGDLANASVQYTV